MTAVKSPVPKITKPTKSKSNTKVVKKVGSKQKSVSAVVETHKDIVLEAPLKVVEAPLKVVEAPLKDVVVDASQSVSSVAPDSVTIESSMTDTLGLFQDSITSLTLALTKIKNDFKNLEKQVIKEARAMDKVNAKRNKSRGSRAPSGFVKPTKISKDLSKFLGVSDDTMIARTDVTKMITAYVKEHKLQAPDNGRKILPDKKLMSLLGCNSDDEVTYFNLQKFMKPHFIKDVVV